MTRETDNRDYDRHNPGCRFSPDVNQRVHGRCGCLACARYRSKYTAVMLTPIDERGAAMGSINTCDRCPSMVSGMALGSVQIRTSSDPDSSEVVTRELCPACVEEVLNVVEFDVEERAQRAFRKPFKRVNDSDPVDSMTAEQLSAALLEKLMKNQGRELTAE